MERLSANPITPTSSDLETASLFKRDSRTLIKPPSPSLKNTLFLEIPQYDTSDYGGSEICSLTSDNSPGKKHVIIKTELFGETPSNPSTPSCSLDEDPLFYLSLPEEPIYFETAQESPPAPELSSQLPTDHPEFIWAFLNYPTTHQIAGMLLLVGGLMTMTAGIVVASVPIATAGAVIAGVGALLGMLGQFNTSKQEESSSQTLAADYLRDNTDVACGNYS